MNRYGVSSALLEDQTEKFRQYDKDFSDLQKYDSGLIEKVASKNITFDENAVSRLDKLHTLKANALGQIAEAMNGIDGIFADDLKVLEANAGEARAAGEISKILEPYKERGSLRCLVHICQEEGNARIIIPSRVDCGRSMSPLEEHLKQYLSPNGKAFITDGFLTLVEELTLTDKFENARSIDVSIVERIKEGRFFYGCVDLDLVYLVHDSPFTAPKLDTMSSSDEGVVETDTSTSTNSGVVDYCGRLADKLGKVTSLQNAFFNAILTIANDGQSHEAGRSFAVSPEFWERMDALADQGDRYSDKSFKATAAHQCTALIDRGVLVRLAMGKYETV